MTFDFLSVTFYRILLKIFLRKDIMHNQNRVILFVIQNINSSIYRDCYFGKMCYFNVNSYHII